jgi:hypothetical protein
MSSSSHSHSRKRKREESEWEQTVVAISHAERRRQKKKKEKPQPEGDDSSLTHRKNRQNSVWVGNLSFKTTPESLRTFFDGVGEITRIHMPAGATNQNRGYVHFYFFKLHSDVVFLDLRMWILVRRRERRVRSLDRNNLLSGDDY